MGHVISAKRRDTSEGTAQRTKMAKIRKFKEAKGETWMSPEKYAEMKKKQREAIGEVVETRRRENPKMSLIRQELKPKLGSSEDGFILKF